MEKGDRNELVTHKKCIESSNYYVFLMLVGQTINTATLRWQNDVVDWDDGVILGVYDLFLPQDGKSYDVTFVDGIYINSMDMSIGSNWHTPDRFVTYDQQYGDKVYATFVETVPLPPSVV